MIKARAAATVAGLLALSVALGPSAGAAPPDPFHGAWKSIDTDGSNQNLSFGGGGTTRQVRLFDDFASGCGGGIATARGIGTVAGDSLDVTLSVRCANGTFIPDTPVTFTYDGGTDTLDDSFGVTWNRP
ncbi:MAG TPA: hypothetical protein VGB28_02405 [Actinomycetota bacterium]|jgi:hypothetical protein